MAYLTSRLDAWMLRRLSGTAVLALLPGGTATGVASIFNNARPQDGTVQPLFVEFYQAGLHVSNCLPHGKEAGEARYYTKAWQTGNDTSTLAPVMDAIEAQFVSTPGYVTEVYNGYRFSVLAQTAEPQQIGVEGGLLYSSTGYEWLIGVEPL